MLNPPQRYSLAQIVLHWATFVLIIAVYATILIREEIPKGEPLRDALRDWHRQLALLAFALVWLRLALRAMLPSPVIQPPPPHWQRRAASAAHIALYAFLIVMPLLGLLMTNAAGRTVTVFGFALPHLIGESKTVADVLKEAHEIIGNAGYALIGLHAAAALYHHWVRRDTTLRHMLARGAGG